MDYHGNKPDGQLLSARCRWGRARCLATGRISPSWVEMA